MGKRFEGAPPEEIEALHDADLEFLRQRWSDLFARAPSPRVSRDVLIRAVAFRRQEEAYGALGKRCRRQRVKLAADLRRGSALVSSQPSLKPRTRLIREWKGKTHEVVIADNTYIWGGKHYRS